MPDAIRVLIVDDNEDHAQLASEFLRASGAFATDTAMDVQELWERLDAQTYDVIALDYNLPDGNGLQALSQIAARGLRVPVVMVTGRGDERVAAQAIQLGAIDYLVKTGDYLRMLPALVTKAVRTHQMMVEAQRSLAQIRYQALLLDNVHDAVVVWDLDHRITFWNRAAEELFGWTVEERLGQSAARCYLETFTPAVEPLASAAGVERRGLRRRGEEVWVSSSVTALHDADGRLIGHMDVSRDITARKRLEAQVQAAQTQLAQAARLSAIGELASGVAHQISNPLTAVIGESQLLLRRLPGDDPVRESVEAIERAGWRAQEAVQRLLDFSRPASATLESLAVNQTVENALVLVRGLIEALGVTLDVTLESALPAVHGNPRQLEDLWVNLLIVARDATDDGRPHRVRVRSSLSEDGWVRVEVADDGAPIPAGLLASIFEPEFTGSVAGRGTGLELSICREIVRQHRGRIAVDSAPDRGTVFTVSLPPEVQNGTH